MVIKKVNLKSYKRLKILISNDDGIYAPGIIALTKALNEVAEVKVVALDRNRSVASHFNTPFTDSKN